MLRRTSRKGAIVLVAAAAAFGTACSSNSVSAIDAGDAGGEVAVPCQVTAPTMCPDPPLRYGDVSDIFGRRCVSCHYGAVGGPWPLLQYSHAADWYDLIQSNMLDCSMPPPESGITMTTDERLAILTWILCGVLE